jgi:TonB-dependent SusC/RagA subfamily outer membrane receptor
MKLSSLLLALLLTIGLGMSACTSTKNAETATLRGEESVEVGYGKQKRKNLTASVNDVETQNPNISLDNYLRKVPGLYVRGSGAQASVTIRGMNSVNLSQEPLFVLNDTPIGNSFAQIASFINPNDIAKVTVLKDASSTSMYGSRGSGGVVVIRTKQ